MFDVFGRAERIFKKYKLRPETIGQSTTAISIHTETKTRHTR